MAIKKVLTLALTAVALRVILTALVLAHPVVRSSSEFVPAELEHLIPLASPHSAQ